MTSTHQKYQGNERQRLWNCHKWEDAEGTEQLNAMWQSGSYLGKDRPEGGKIPGKIQMSSVV